MDYNRKQPPSNAAVCIVNTFLNLIISKTSEWILPQNIGLSWLYKYLDPLYGVTLPFNSDVFSLCETLAETWNTAWKQLAYVSPNRQSAWMSKITNDGLTRSDTGCFITVPIWQQWAWTERIKLKWRFLVITHSIAVINPQVWLLTAPDHTGQHWTTPDPHWTALGPHQAGNEWLFRFDDCYKYN